MPSSNGQRRGRPGRPPHGRRNYGHDPLPDLSTKKTVAQYDQIICAEHLYKLAGGLIFRAARQELLRACGQRQFGYSRPGGAPREASEAQAARSCNPDWPVLTIDVKNAFGSVTWTDAATIMEQKAPSTAAFLATQWQNGSTTLLIEDKPAVWLRQQVTGSLLQGGHDGHPTFCITLWHHIQRALPPPSRRPNNKTGFMSKT